MRHSVAIGNSHKPTTATLSVPSSTSAFPAQYKRKCNFRLISLLLIVTYTVAKQSISTSRDELKESGEVDAVYSTAGTGRSWNILGKRTARIEDDRNAVATTIAWILQTQQYRLNFRYDGNSNGTNFCNKLLPVSSVVTYVLGVLSVWIMVTSLAHLLFFALSQLQHVAVDCRRLVADRYSKSCCIHIRKAFSYHTTQQQHRHPIKPHSYDVAHRVMAAITTTTTSTTTLFLKHATQLYLTKRNSSVISLLSHQLLAIYMTSITAKGKAASSQAPCTGELLILIFLLHQFHFQQRQQGVSVPQWPQSQPHAQSNNCSQHCGNMYEKQQQHQQRGAPTSVPQQQEHNLRIRQIQRLYDRCAWISAIVGASRKVDLIIMAGSSTVHAYYEQDHRHRRRRRRRCCTPLPATGTGVLQRQPSAVQKQQPSRTVVPTLAQSSYQYSNRRCPNECVCSLNCSWVCCFRAGHCSWDDCCAKNNNYSSTSGKSSGGIKGQVNIRCCQSTNYSCCCCCYCHCGCHFCCFCCCCCCCFCNCHGIYTNCCCCRCVCCYKQSCNRSAKSDNPKDKSNRASFNVNDNGKNCRGDNGSSHQQHQQTSQKEYYQQQHKRQQQQHLFYQQNSCFHRRRRRHFCASYTSLHSCCCCFFKWICWRHHNSRKQSEQKPGLTVSTLADAVKPTQSYLSVPIVFRKLLFASQYFRNHFRASTTAKSQNHLLLEGNIATRNRKNRVRTGEPLQKQVVQKSRKDSLAKNIRVLNINALRTITENETSSSTCTTVAAETLHLRTPTTRTVNLQCAVGSEVTRTYVRLLRRNLVWLIIGLVWLEGPKFAECGSLQTTNAGLGSESKIANYSVEVNHSGRTQSSDRSDSRLAPPVPSHIIPDVTKPTKVNRGLILKKRLARLRTPRHWPEASHSREDGNRYQSDTVRLESIKRQILSKLGLKRKPNVTHPLPKQFIWDTIYRADGISSVSDFDFNDNHRAQKIVTGRDTLAHKYTTYEFSEMAPHRTNNRVARSQTKSTAAASTHMGHNTISRFANFRNNDAIDIEEDISPQQYQLLILQQHHKKQQKFIYSKSSYSKPDDGGIKLSVGDFEADASAYVSAGNQGYRMDHDKEETDEFYGRTQEIITFADRGETYKKHQLIEFSRPIHEIPNQKLHIRLAEIHIRIDKVPLGSTASMRKARTSKLKLWIFQLSSGDFSKRGFDQMARFCTSLSIDSRSLGWQKINLTETVQRWYELSSGEKLRLLIDCSGCGKDFVLHLFEFPKPTVLKTSQKKQTDFRKNLSFQKNILEEPFNAIGHNFRKHQEKNDYWRNANVNRNLTILRKPQEPLNNYKYFSVNSKNQVPKSDESEHGTGSFNAHFASIAISDPVGHKKPINDFHNSDDHINPNRPFLVLHTEPKRSRRVRRRVIDCDGALHGQCCKESFYVSFKALGWDDWIIAPRGYFANYCRGDCSGPYRTPDTFQTFHAHFIEEYRKMGLLNGMQPCCAPVKFSSMSLIYYGDDGIIKRDLPKMVIDECGCP